jgi:hypothetical protein
MIADRDFKLSLLPDSIKMQMGERRDWQSVKLPRQAGQPEQRFPARSTENVCTVHRERVALSLCRTFRSFPSFIPPF